MIINRLKQGILVEGTHRNNIGDVLQGMAAAAFMNHCDLYVDRENTAAAAERDPTFLIANGWYMSNYEAFPPPKNLNPFYISMHVSSAEFLSRKEVQEHFLKHAPIGCRDHKTLMVFRAVGIPSYYSGCLTSTIKRRPATPTDDIVLVMDRHISISSSLKNHLENAFEGTLKEVFHEPKSLGKDLNEYVIDNTALMNEFLTMYCGAKKVITNKIHCALPCLSMGVNVTLLHDDLNDPRLDTIKEFMSILPLSNLGTLHPQNCPKVNTHKLRKRQKFLKKVMSRALEQQSNPFANTTNEWFGMRNYFYKTCSQVSHFALKTLYRMGFAKEKLGKVYQN